jgi:hypothetical protein
VLLLNPPRALTEAAGNFEGVMISGAKVVLGMTRTADMVRVLDISSEAMWGNFLEGEEHSGAIDSLNPVAYDSSALDDYQEYIQRIVTAFKSIQRDRMVWLGLLSFEGNAFQTDGFAEYECPPQFVRKLQQIHAERRQSLLFPNVLDNRGIPIKFLGPRAEFFNVGSWNQMLVQWYKYGGSAIGLVANSQGASNFFILKHNIHPNELPDSKKTWAEVSSQTWNQIFALCNTKQITPICWFKLDFGADAFNAQREWDLIRAEPTFEGFLLAKRDYIRYLTDTINALREAAKQTQRAQAAQRAAPAPATPTPVAPTPTPDALLADLMPLTDQISSEERTFFLDQCEEAIKQMDEWLE